MAQAKTRVRRRLGDLLVAEGLINQEQLQRALLAQKGTAEKLGSLLVRLNLVDEDKLVGFLSKQYGIPSVTLSQLDIDPDVLKLVPAQMARKYEIVPVLDEDEGAKVDIFELKESADEAPIVKLVNMVLVDAIRRGASDIHLEPYEKVFRIRFRVDGVLHEIMTPPKRLEPALISRVK